MTYQLTCLALFAFSLYTIACANKYTKEVNKNWHEDENNPFKSLKVNQLWEKAKKRLSGPRLADMYADLRVQDKYEMELKKYLLDDLDKDGMKEAETRLRFRTIVKNYGLLEQFKHVDPEMSNDIPTGSDLDKTMELGDKKLQKIWKKALLSGFSDEELDKLKMEFWHQQMKIDEYNSVRDEMTGVDDIDSNTLGRVKTDGLDSKEKHKDLKMRHKQVKDGYLKLESLSTNKDLEFEDPRVYQLWAVAKKANMSEDELTSFKSELKHFEHRISKHEYMKDQVLMSKYELRGEVKDGQYPDKHKKLEEKAQDYGRKVKKIHADLKKQVDKAFARHTEL
ncbi:alpha-2-macroglobulin receptor-associated protein-like [Haliotis rufescens]|uniref:alpha-2-macroglobulin receptor-associated protein-like n=1 Tax=Haliotis rufescens TaxID=6454 RepID=UPI00201F7156|nr:alpha-2-macroglobulin receptor-associated protein-like [Haliotis rufescens]